MGFLQGLPESTTCLTSHEISPIAAKGGIRGCLSNRTLRNSRPAREARAERKLSLPTFQRTKKKATRKHAAEIELVSLPTEIVILILNQLYWLSEKNISYVRLVSHDFEALVSPLVFRNIRLTGDIAGFPRIANYSKQHTQRVTVDNVKELIPSYALKAISHMNRFEVFKLKYASCNSMMCDEATFHILRGSFSKFTIHIESGCNRIIMDFAARDSTTAELRSMMVEMEILTCFRTFAIKSKEWDTIDTLIVNGILEMGRSEIPSLKTLKLDCSPKTRPFKQVRSATHLQQLNEWFPNLEHFELNFQDDNGLFHPDETETFMDKLTAFRNLLHLSLKTFPYLIEGPTYGKNKGKKSKWLEGSPDMKNGPNRMATYMTRSAILSINVFKFLLIGKKGVPFTKLDLTVEAGTIKAGHQDDKEQKPKGDCCREERSVFECVPKVTCEWEGGQRETGEPVISMHVAERDRCLGCSTTSAIDVYCYQQFGGVQEALTSRALQSRAPGQKIELVPPDPARLKRGIF